jgi:hypothetical protein
MVGRQTDKRMGSRMMQRSEAAKVLTLCAVYDRRTIGETDATEWHNVLESVRFEDATVAVRQYYATTRQWVMPSDVLAGVKRLRAERLARETDQLPTGDPDDVVGYLRDLRQIRRQVADGTIGTEIAVLR